MKRTKEQVQQRIDYLRDCLTRDEGYTTVNVDGVEWLNRHVWGAIQMLEGQKNWI